MTANLQASELYERVKSVILPAEWSEFAPDVDAINRLKREKNAVILAHNYQTPEIFHGVADIVGDSLALAREAMTVDAEVIVLAGVHFMAETAKLLNPAKRVLIPDLRAGCSLAASITAEDVRLLRQRWPGVPVVTYVNTSAAVKAESDICCTSGNAEEDRREPGRAEGDHAARRVPGPEHRPRDRRRDRHLGGPLRGPRALLRRRRAPAPRRPSRRRRAGPSRMPARGRGRGRFRRLDRGDGRLCRRASGRAASC